MNYLHRRNGVYYYRQRLPLEIGSGHINKSLKTKDLNTAKDLLKLISYNVNLIFKQLIRDKMTEEETKSIIHSFIEQSLSMWEDDQDHTKSYQHWSQKDKERTELEHHLGEAKEWAYINDQQAGEWCLSGLELTDVQLKSIPTDKQKRALLKKKLLTAHVEVFEEYLRRFDGDYSHDILAKYKPKQQLPATPEPITESKPLASELIDNFVEDQAKRNSSTSKTIASNKAKVSSLIKLIGNKPVDTYTRQDLKDLRGMLESYPKNKHKRKLYRDLSPKELIAMDIPKEDRLSAETVNNYMIRIASFFEWLQLEQYRTDNIGKKLTVSTGKNPKDAKDPYSFEELATVFSHKTFTKDFHKVLSERPERIFIPLLGLYHGIRINEASQLFEENIIEVDGVPSIDIKAVKTKGQRLKNLSSPRTIPIHPKLIEAGFLRYVAYRRTTAPQQLLWKQLTYTENNGYGSKMSKWYNDTVLKGLGLKALPNRKLDFHSFRHTVADLFHNSDIPIRHYQAFIGHAEGSITTGVYGKALSPKTMLDMLHIIDYSDIQEVNTLIESLAQLEWSTDS